MSRLCSLVFALCFVPWVGGISAADAPLPREGADPAICAACGRNSAYIFLGLHGYHCDFNMVTSAVPVGPNGTSMLDLEKGVSKCGLDSLVVRCSYDDLMQMNFPVVGWIRSPRASDKSIGHYVVILASNEQTVEYIDGTSGKRRVRETEQFCREWNERLLVPKNAIDPSGGLRRSLVVVFAFGFAVVVTLVWLRGREGRVASCVLFLLLMYSPQCPAFTIVSDLPEKGYSVWRTERHDSVNALYLLLRSHGVDCDYAEVAEACPQGRVSLGLLREAAGRFGLDVDVLRCRNPEDLKELRLPFLLHMERPLGTSTSESPGCNGSISLVSAIPEGCYHLFECGHVLFEEMPEESLRLNWSGYVLAVRSNNRVGHDRAKLWLSVLIGGAAILAYWNWQRKQTRELGS